jgi:MraZ protein
MLAGQYHHQLDHKNRVSVPKKFRSVLVDGGILTRGLDGCLFLYSHETWKGLVEKLNKLPLTGRDARALSRFFLSNASEVSYDKLGRIAIPSYLLDFGKIVSEITFVGMGERVELWSSAAWKIYQEINESQAAEVAEKLSHQEIDLRI